MAKLYLIPTTISDQEFFKTLPDSIGEIIKTLRCFIVEERPTAERFLKKFNLAVSDLVFFELNEHTPLKDAENFFNQNKHKDIGILSEAGVPCVADPGAPIVLLAHKHNVQVVPLVGPSSILLALMGSGLNGQNFAFNGYLPKDKEERRKKIKMLEERSAREGQTQIFMEAPHHNQKTFEDLLVCCHPQTLLCLAVDLTSASQEIKTQTIQEWRIRSTSNELDFSAPVKNSKIRKRPALFLLQKK